MYTYKKCQKFDKRVSEEYNQVLFLFLLLFIMFGVDKVKNMVEELATKLTSGELLDAKTSKEGKELDETYANERHSLL